MYLSDLLLYKLSFNHLLITPWSKHDLPNFNAADNRITELYSYTFSSAEQNVIISCIIVRLTYIRGLTGQLAEAVRNATTRYKMEIGPEKTKVMTNNPNGFESEIKIKSQMLESLEYFKYLGSIISNEGSKPEILSTIAQTTASLSRLKIIWRDKNISLASKVKLMRTLILSTFLYACKSWILTAKLKEGSKPLR